MTNSEATAQDTPIFIRWAHRIVNVIFVGVMLSILGFWLMEGLGKSTANSPAAWSAAYACFGGLMLAAILCVVLVVHAFDARTIALLKWPFALLALTFLSLGVREFVQNRLG